MQNTSRLKDHSLVPDFNPENSLGLQEREMLLMITGPQERLDYPTETLKMSNGCKVERYVIPDADRQRVLDVLYPFAEQPSLDDVRLDIHTSRLFKVREYIVTREGNGNFLVTPYYAEAGGTVLDWVKPDQDTNQVLKTKGGSATCIRTIGI
ncbi:MAG: hypothetical protein J5792_01200 [Bacteroidales bacterium]|nr:hypothetical protein [Bacteroidales bacterium]